MTCLHTQQNAKIVSGFLPQGTSQKINVLNSLWQGRDRQHGKVSPRSWLPYALGNIWPRENVLEILSCLQGTDISSLKQNDMHEMSLGGHFLLIGKRRSPVGQVIGFLGGSILRPSACRCGQALRNTGESEVILFLQPAKKEGKKVQTQDLNETSLYWNSGSIHLVARSLGPSGLALLSSVKWVRNNDFIELFGSTNAKIVGKCFFN